MNAPETSTFEFSLWSRASSFWTPLGWFYLLPCEYPYVHHIVAICYERVSTFYRFFIALLRAPTVYSHRLEHPTTTEVHTIG
eukprot:4049461-Amphidinium_carterae.1